MNMSGNPGARVRQLRILIAVFSVLAWMPVSTASVDAEDNTISPDKSAILSAAEIDYPPLCFVTKEGRATGFAVELLAAAAAAMDREVTFRTGPWPEVKGLLERGEIDALPLVGRTPEREAIFDFTFPYLSLHGAIVVRKGTADIRGVEDLRDRDVAVLQADNAEEYLRRSDLGCRIHMYPSFETALRELSAGRHDAVVIQRLLALRIIAETGLTNLEIVGKPLADFRQDFCFAVPEGDHETLALLNEGLALVMADGTAEQLKVKWLRYLEAPAYSIAVVLRYAAMIVGPLLVVMLMLVVLVWVLRREVGRRTAELARSRDRIMESHARYKLVVEGASGGIWDWDVSKQQIYFSREWKEMRGYAEHEIGSSENEWIDGIHPDDKPRIMAALEDHFEGRTDVFEEEYRVRHKDDHYFWVFDRGKAFYDDAGQVIRMAGSELDITERKQAEEEKEKLENQLRQSQKMEAVGRLAGGVAHDFNNMLFVILGHADMILEQVDPDQPIHADLTEIRDACERSVDLTRQLLAFARKQTVAPKVIDLNETVAGMTRMLQRLIGEDIDLAWMPGEKLWPVRIDPSQIDQILANLCVNARDAIASVGNITIETDNTAFGGTDCADHTGFIPGEYVMLAVSDNGRGMAPETLDNLFEPFFTTKESGKGTGLGLATVYGAVKQNDGFINVYSEPGQGTTFKIYLPRYQAKAARLPEQGPSQPTEHGRETILLVEDEPAILRMTTMMLERLGYTVLAAGAPGEAVRLSREYAGEIHLLLTDVVMPKMNGRDLVNNIMVSYPNLKHLFMSGYTANVIAHHGVLDEGVNFIQKPFSGKMLGAKIREVLGEGKE